MTPKLFLSEEDTNDNDSFYEIPAHVTHIDDNAIERLKKNITGISLEMMIRNWIPILFNIISQALLNPSCKIHEGSQNFYCII